MWILKNSKQLLHNLQSNSITSVNSIKTFDFSTLYTTFPIDQLKSRLASIVNQSFCFKNGKKRYEYIVKYNSTYFVKSHAYTKHKYTEDDIVRMINFLIDNIYVECGGEIFQQVIGILMGTNCAPLLADIFVYSYEAELIQTLRVYSDWTRQRQFDGVKHDTTHVSQSEHSDRPGHSAATAACVGIRSINDALLNRNKEMSQSEVVALFSNANNNNRIAVSTPEYHNRFGSGFTSISMMWTFKHDFDADPFNRD